MDDGSQPPALAKTLQDWVIFRRAQSLNLRRSYTIRVLTLGGPTLWGDIELHGAYRIQKHHITGHYRILDRKDRRVFWGTYPECIVELAERDDAPPLVESGRHLVLCLHGIFRSKNAMNRMRDGLINAGFNAWSINYPSTIRTIDQHAEQVANLLARCTDVESVSFVCHSMGGLIARAVLADKDAPWRKQIRPHRLVMIGTPNSGAFLAQELSEKSWIFRVVAGPAGIQLTPDWVNKLPIPDIEFGIIAGGTGDNRGFNPFLPGDDDMTVTVDSAKLEGAKDFFLYKAIHTFIMQKPAVIDASVRFIADGRFVEMEE